MATNKMDQGNIIRQVYDPTSESLNVNIVGSGSPSLPSTVRLSDGTGYISSTTALGYRALDVSIKNIPEILISHTDDSIRLGDGTNLISSTTNGLKQGLDVNIINTIIGVQDASALTELQSINSKLTSPITITGTVNLGTIGDVATETTLSSINNKIPTNLTVTANRLLVDGSGVTQPVSVLTLPLPTGAATESTLNNILTSLSTGISVNEPLLISGTDDGTPTGTEYSLVYNLRQQILASHDRDMDITYADFGTKNQRVTQIDYTSGTFPGFTARKVLSYTLVGTNYRRDSITWSIV